MWILSCALQLRHGLAKTPGIKKVFTQFESKLEIGWISRHALQRIVDENFCAFGFGGLQFLRLFRTHFICIVSRKKFLVGSDLLFEIGRASCRERVQSWE